MVLGSVHDRPIGWDGLAAGASRPSQHLVAQTWLKTRGRTFLYIPQGSEEDRANP